MIEGGLQIGSRVTKLGPIGTKDYKRQTDEEWSAQTEAWIDHMMGDPYVCVRLRDGRVIHVSLRAIAPRGSRGDGLDRYETRRATGTTERAGRMNMVSVSVHLEGQYDALPEVDSFESSRCGLLVTIEVGSCTWYMLPAQARKLALMLTREVTECEKAEAEALA
jgi:hypothetical protein